MTPLSEVNPLLPVRSLLVAYRDNPWGNEDERLRALLGGDARARILLSEDRRMLVGFAERRTPFESDTNTRLENGLPERLRLALGDSGEFDQSQPETPMANGAWVEIDIKAKRFAALASVVGLPPLYLMESAGEVLLTSDLLCLAAVRPSGLAFERESVLDLCAYGFPVAHRTLFREVRLVPGGNIVQWEAGKSIATKRAWEFHTAAPLARWEDYTEQQIAAFLSALQRTNLDDSFLSLTAGLDTRTIFAALMTEQRMIPTFTLSGESPSLDARTARALCRAYGVSHQAIPLDAEFRQKLVECTVEASRLSGGLASLGQAHQVYLYKQLPRAFSGRISGNMGNQLGRKGVEHVTMRGADPRLLNAELQQRLRERPAFAWSSENTGGVATHSYEFLFQQEFPFTQVGNYSIGSHFAMQQSPYASRELIALCHKQPLKAASGDGAVSPLRLRINDLRHRFLGEPETYSFQRRLIHQVGGVAASYPINWGWRAAGGVSVGGVFWGGMALVDAYTERAGWVSGVRGNVLRSLRIAGLHEHRKPKSWLKDSLRDFVYDVVRSGSAKDSGLFDLAVLSKLLDEHYSGQGSHHRALVFALDLALAATNFQARLT